jgi:hypothetical protein
MLQAGFDPGTGRILGPLHWIHPYEIHNVQTLFIVYLDTSPTEVRSSTEVDCSNFTELKFQYSAHYSRAQQPVVCYSTFSYSTSLRLTILILSFISA